MRALFLIFILSLLVRFLYFPGDVYFSFDQARDAFVSLEAIKGDFKLIGPPSAASEYLFPGPLIYYFEGPVYFLFNNSPLALSAVFRIYNALGVFLVFAIGVNLFSKRVGLIAALFFALSFEQSQYNLFLSHQTLAVLTVLLYYWGLSLVIFKDKSWGAVLAVLGLGLSIQFHYSYLFLIPLLLILIAIFKDRFAALGYKYIFSAFLVFLLTVSTFIIAEVKFNFRLFHEVLTLNNRTHFSPGSAIDISWRFIQDNLVAANSLIPLFAILIIFFFIKFWKTTQRSKLVFLLLWFLGGLPVYILSGVPSYFYGATASVALTLFVSFLIDYYWQKRFFQKRFFLAQLAIVAVAISNLYLITTISSKGPNPYLFIQPGMFVKDQQRALDYIYKQAAGEPFSVSALTIPLNVNTLWSYLFEWYGQEKFGYLPIWDGATAAGFPGHLKAISAKSDLPKIRFVIIEPTVGIQDHDKKKFFELEGYFTNIVEERRFGEFIVQKREPLAP